MRGDLVEAVRNTYEENRKMKRWKKVTFIIIGILIFLVVAMFIFVSVFLNRTLPQVSGEVQLASLQDTVILTRDEQGVPHIEAENSHDLFMAQGYAQAQDRLFQMELAKRQASGTLSEVVGEATIDQDKYFRTLGLRRAAEDSIADYSEETLESLKAFAEGVNGYMEQAINENRLPIEFKLMGVNPEPWEPVDSLTIGKFMAFDLGGHWERQAFNYFAIHEFPKDQAEEIMPTYPKAAPSILNEEEVDVASSFKGAVLPEEFNGSNNWVVDGNLTESGMPLLADDPHLGLATPSIWYQMHLNSPEYNVSGVIFAGVPGVILGHNQDVSWGVTNVGPDVQQLYLEKRNPEDESEFLYEDQWEEAKVIDEPIAVKGEDRIDYTVMETRHGPIISEFAKKSGEESVMSLRWTALDSTTELEAVLEINRASNWEEFEKGLEKFLAPAQNFVFASSDGTIAYKANGRIPIYEEAEDALLPLRGWESEDEWKGYIPFEELPTTVNPDKGFVATANNKIVTDNYPYHISHNWAQPYRYQRIVKLIEATDSHTIESMKDIQMDIMNLQAKEFLPFFLGQLNDSDDQVVKLMQDWNYEDDKELPQPLIFHDWMANIQERIFSEKINKEILKLFHGAGQTTDELLRMEMGGEASIWIKEAGGITEVVQSAFNQTINDHKKQLGNDPRSWQWGDYHAVEFTHPLSSIGFLERFYNPGDPTPVSGSRVTVQAAGFNKDGIVNHGAPWRFVSDLSTIDQAEHVVGPGQSGHFRSEWYHDQLEDWVNGGYHTTSLSEFEGEELILSP
ncbi:penicillin acylase family protein [Halobacillus seohaensis]|uniref:Penicillin acylase family protein n=1 Tax=Halobacillus seohaensis TaxID=447421 RepID=A0ABW2EKE6_9BACI